MERRIGSRPMSVVFLSIAGCFLLATGCVETGIYRIAPKDYKPGGEFEGRGVVFSLPRTVLDVEVPVRRVTMLRSPFLIDVHGAAEEMREYVSARLRDAEPAEAESIHAIAKQIQNPLEHPRYAEIVMHLNRLGVRLCDREKTSYERGEVRLSSRSEPDPDQLYAIDLRGDAFLNRLMELRFSETGVISEAGLEIEDNRVEVAVKVLETVARIAAITQGGKWPIESLSDNPLDKIFSYAEEILDQVQDLRALRAAHRPRTDLAAVPLNASLVPEERTDQERSLMSYFQDQDVSIWTATHRIVPGDPSNSGAMEFDLLGFSPTSGCAAGAPDPRVERPPIPDPFMGTSRGSRVVLSLKPRRPGSLPDPPPRQPRPVKGFPYRVPVFFDVEIREGNRLLTRATLPIAQLSELAYLPVHQLSRFTSFHLSLYPHTGALQEFSVRSRGYRASDLQPVQEAILEGLWGDGD